MRILICGAGVLGSQLAHVLCKKNDVTLLVRGRRKEYIGKNGLTIRHLVQMKTTVDFLKVIDSLEPEDKYDLIFAVTRAEQLLPLCESIARNISAHIVFVGNNMAAPETAKRATSGAHAKEIAFAFLQCAGRRSGEKVISVHAGLKMTIGAPIPPLSQEFQDKLKEAFKKTACRMAWENQMDAWLKCHAALVLPMCYLCYVNDGNLSQANHTERKAAMDAQGEGYMVLQKLGFPILPAGDEKWFVSPRRPIMASIFFLIYKTPIGRLTVSDHAMSAVSEMKYLDKEFEKLRDKAGISTPAWDLLRNKSEIAKG